MENDGKKLRFVWSNFLPLLSGIIFLWIFYIVYYVWKTPLEISSSAVWEFSKKYSIFIPLIYSLFTIIILYILYAIKWVLRLNFWIINFLLLMSIYWFNAFFWIQLLYFEPRYTDIAIFIIDTFWKWLMYASIGSLVFIFLSIFISKKKIS